jgi:hypothetical protein
MVRIQDHAGFIASCPPAVLGMSPRLVLFTGAPEVSSLDWDDAGLLNTFCEPIARFAHLDGYNVNQDIIPSTPPSAPGHPAWRSLPLDRQHLPTGISQDHTWKEEYQGAQFFATSYINSFMEEVSEVPTGDTRDSSLQSTEQVLSQFYEESYAVHRDIPSSQIAAVSQASTSFRTDGTSFNTSGSSDSPLRPLGQGKDVPVAGQLSNLRDIPNSLYLNSIHPQTMTVNLIVGIISNPAPRAIRTRRGADVQLIEILVGDETKSGFGINFWLSSSQPGQEDTKSILDGLRPQDVVLVRNVALNSFRGKVYGQSLRKEMTKVHLLYRNRIDKTDIRGCYSAADLAAGEMKTPQVEKTQRVREWVLRFIGLGAGQRNGKRSAEEAFREELPPDTQ